MKKKKLILNKKDYERLNEMIMKTGGEIKKQYLKDLRNEIENADIVNPEQIPADYITMNSKIRFKDIETEESFIFTIVYPSDADTGQGKMSVLAPIGTALLGNRVGDIISWQVPDGQKKFRVEEILYQPEANKNFDL